MSSNSFNKWSDSTRIFIADTLAMVIFSTVIGMCMEVFVVGLTFTQSIQARVTAIPASLIIARPYGKYRDWIFKKFKVDFGNQLQQGVADIFANASFQIPIYILILLSTGATAGQILKGVGSLAILMLIIGRPYGLFLTFIRWISGV